MVGEHGGKLLRWTKTKALRLREHWIRDPEVIVFDEATSALDSIS